MATLTSICVKNILKSNLANKLEKDMMYRDLLAEFKEASPEIIELSLSFLQVAAQMNIRKEALFSNFGLTSGRFSLLMLLRREPRRALSPSDLAKKAGVKRATMTQFIDALEKEDLVERMDDLNDRRAMLIHLTPKADSLLKKVLPPYLKSLSHITKVLNRTERRQFLNCLEKLNESLQENEALP